MLLTKQHLPQCSRQTSWKASELGVAQWRALKIPRWNKSHRWSVTTASLNCLPFIKDNRVAMETRRWLIQGSLHRCKLTIDKWRVLRLVWRRSSLISHRHNHRLWMNHWSRLDRANSATTESFQCWEKELMARSTSVFTTQQVRSLPWRHSSLKWVTLHSLLNLPICL